MVSMLNAALSALAFATAASTAFTSSSSSSCQHHGKSCTAQQRAQALLSQMTWEEKIGQMGGVRRILSSGSTINPNYETIKKTQNGQMGFGPMFNWAKDIMPLVNSLRLEQVNSSRLHIPYITVTDSINGLLISGGTVFPSNLAMSSSFNLPLFKGVVEAIREEQLSIGVKWVLSPPLDVAREPRYGRIGELFGEDGYLIGEFGRVYVETMEEKDENGYTKVACTIKHFVYGDARGGVNTASQYGGINHLFNDQLRPYIHVLETTSPASLMVSYATVDLVPMSANEYMLQDILRDKLGFKGLITSDAFSIPNLYTQSKTATSLEDAALQALNAGLQMELAPGNPPAFPTLISSINDTRVAKLIDAAVLKMLEIKYASGVFEQPLANLNVMNKTLRAAAHLDLARQMARESIALLKNDGLLPYPLKGTGKLAIIGPFGDILNPGSYAAVNVSNARYGSSLYRSAVSAFGVDRVTFTQGCDIVDTTNATNSIPDAVTAAKEAGFAVLMLGSLSDAPEDMTMAPKRTDGEFFAHADLGFPGLQQQLLDAVLDTGVPTVLILTGGQPFVLQQSTLSRVNAIFHSFLGGEFTGDALIELLTGHVNPSAKLTISMPQHTGAIPAMYDYLPSDDQGGWASLGYQSAWQFPNLTRTVPMPFGFGLSYTTFDISTPIATVQEKNKAVVVATTVRNTGTRKGKEVVQVYFRPATTRGLEFPVKRLVRFEKVELAPGESRDVNFNIPYKDLGVWINAKPTTFMGLYNIWVGSSSREEDLRMVNVTLV